MQTVIEVALVQGEVVGAYPDDPWGESCLVLGMLEQNRSMLYWDGRE